jgi:hypothetical protein
VNNRVCVHLNQLVSARRHAQNHHLTFTTNVDVQSFKSHIGVSHALIAPVRENAEDESSTISADVNERL